MTKINGVLSDTKCYLIGHMEFLDGRGWRNTVKERLSNKNITFFDPYNKPFVSEVDENEESRKEMYGWRENQQYDLVANRMKLVRGYDLRLCDLSDWFIAVINPKIASWGSAEEISTLIKEKKPIFLVIDDPKGKRACPLWLFGMMPHKYIYNTLDDALKVIIDIDNGIIPIDSDRWKLLKPQLR